MGTVCRGESGEQGPAGGSNRLGRLGASVWGRSCGEGEPPAREGSSVCGERGALAVGRGSSGCGERGAVYSEGNLCCW